MLSRQTFFNVTNRNIILLASGPGDNFTNSQAVARRFAMAEIKLVTVALLDPADTLAQLTYGNFSFQGSAVFGGTPEVRLSALLLYLICQQEQRTLADQIAAAISTEFTALPTPWSLVILVDVSQAVNMSIIANASFST